MGHNRGSFLTHNDDFGAMLIKDKDLKRYYSISEVAEQFGVTEAVLRFWETKFPQLKPHRAGRGVRQYSKDDVRMVEVIYDLVKRRGMKIAVAREALNKNKQGVFRANDALTTLRNIREQLIVMRNNIGGVIPGAEYNLKDGEE